MEASLNGCFRPTDACVPADIQPEAAMLDRIENVPMPRNCRLEIVMNPWSHLELGCHQRQLATKHF
ncbi:hypothetical protein [Synechococcus sp. MIT S9501]|uniref:hypothetical protein n=1 Tax=Synechococcus sp. MIT S9501 TaxID=3082545 RepID=UPI0039B68726